MLFNLTIAVCMLQQHLCAIFQVGNIIICRLDAQFVIKIADFGLTEDMYARNYFRQGQGTAVKLPVKWMAPESLQDGIFSNKTDVVSQQWGMVVQSYLSLLSSSWSGTVQFSC